MIYLANSSQQKTGGGWSFIDNFKQGLGGMVTDYDSAAIYFISSASMVSRDEVNKAKADGKKIVLRVDNALRNSRNRNTGMSRLKEFSQVADLVIYQSAWARDFLQPFLKQDGEVILNGVDTKRFKPAGKPPEDSYLYARSSRDEGKQWIMAWYWFVNNPGTLEIVGKFSPDNLDYNFDFYNNERYRFMGEQYNMVDCYQRNRYFLYTYLNDACSNTLLEARAVGCQIVDVYGMLQTGGAPEIMACKDISLERMCAEYEQLLSNLT